MAHAVALLAPALLLRHRPQPAGPPARALAQEHHALAVLAHVRDRERVRLGPAGPAHARGEHADTDVLARAPARVEAAHLDAREPERGADGRERRGADARLREPEERVAGPDEARGEDVAGELGHVHVDLRVR